MNVCISLCDCCHSGLLNSSSSTLSGMSRTVSGWLEGFGAGIFSFQMSLRWDLCGSLWGVLPVTFVWRPDCMAVSSPPVLFFCPDSHHLGLPRSHSATEGWPRGLLYEHPEHRAVSSEVNPGPSVGCGWYTESACLLHQGDALGSLKRRFKLAESVWVVKTPVTALA